MTDEKKVIYTHFEGMCWPVPGERMNEIERTMRHSTPGAPTAWSRHPLSAHIVRW